MSFQKIKSSTSRCFDISTAALHIIAMLFMLMDHLWATLLPAQEWLTCVGRIAFPIFAFMSVEGYFHTHNFKKYLLRMLVFAVISEIPFDLMYGGTWFYPVHQNVIWTFILGLLGIHIMETVRKKKKTPVFVLTAILVTIAGGLLGTLTMVKYCLFEGKTDNYITVHAPSDIDLNDQFRNVLLEKNKNGIVIGKIVE